MATLYLRKLYDSFVPADAESVEAMEKLKANDEYKCEITKTRNYPFLKKFYALLNIAFDAFEPENKQYKGQDVKKNRDAFRKEIIILAGYYEATYKVDGSLKLVAKSISFASMTEDEFSKLYSSVVDVILAKVLTNYTKDDIDNVVSEVIGFG